MSEPFLVELDLIGVYRGRARTLKVGRPESAINKSKVLGRVQVGLLGLCGDEQADLHLHGGPDKAIHYYPAEHYGYWNGLLGSRPEGKKFGPGDFGENFSAFGLDEQSVCIGDLFQVGECRVQVTQGRTPCWKLNEHTGVRDMAALFVKTGRTGWYLRVVTEGCVAVGDKIELIKRPNPRFSVRDITWARLGRNMKLIEKFKISRIPYISSGWAASFAQIEDTKKVNDPSLNWVTPHPNGVP